MRVYRWTLCAVFVLYVKGLEANTGRVKRNNYVFDDLVDSMASTPKPYLPPNTWYNVIPSEGTPISSLVGKRQADQSQEPKPKDDEIKQLDELEGMLPKDYSLDEPRNDDFDEEKRGLDTLGGMHLHYYKRPFDTLGGRQLFDYKRTFDTLGGMNSHNGYKRYFSSLGGGQIYDYKKRGFDMPDKRYLSSLGGGLVHGYKRSFDTLGGMNLYKRYLSSLGGHNVDYKRGIDDFGEANEHDGYKRFLSSLGGGNIHSTKRVLSSLGGGNVYDVYKRQLSSLGGAQIHAYKRGDEEADIDSLDRFKRSEETKQASETKAVSDKAKA